MKLLAPLIAMLSAPEEHRTRGAILRLVGTLVLAVVVFSVGFHAVMAMEGREFSWWSSVYWTVVTMSTLGFGDIVFESDLGRMYSVVVLLIGSLLILVLLPFTFIQFVYVPWREAQQQARAPRQLPSSTRGHVILTGREPMEEVLIRRAAAAGVPYVLLIGSLDEAVATHDEGYAIMVGALDDPETYRAARADQAAMLVTARSDQVNTNVVFTMREVTGAGTVVATATSHDSVDVLELAGCDHVLHLGELLGTEFARRILSPAARSREISRFEDLVIAEAGTTGTPLVGRTPADLDLRRRVGVAVLAIWERGELRMGVPDAEIPEGAVLVLAGHPEQLEAYDELIAAENGLAGHEPADEAHVVVLGGGRVGRSAARSLGEAGISATVVERLPERVRPEGDYVVGDAADLEVLERAGIGRATAVVITTHDDDMNVYLTIYCRRLRPDIEILGRVNVDRNVTTMHRAGADFVLSYASAGATEAWNLLGEDTTILLAEGLLVFRVPIPDGLAGRRLADLHVPAETGCRVVGIVDVEGRTSTQVDPHAPLPTGGDLLLIGDEAAERSFYRQHVNDDDSRWRRWLRRGRPRPGAPASADDPAR